MKLEFLTRKNKANATFRIRISAAKDMKANHLHQKPKVFPLLYWEFQKLHFQSWIRQSSLYLHHHHLSGDYTFWLFYDNIPSGKYKTNVDIGKQFRLNFEEEVEKYKALVDCYKSENKYTSSLLSKTNKEKMELFK